MKTRLISLTLLLSLVALPAQAIIYDLTSDWSYASNPNGPWSYRSATGTVLSFLAGRGSDPWSTPQPAWGELPGWFKSNGTELFAHDWLAGDVITHTASQVYWTSPAASQVAISGAVWATRDIGSFNTWTLYLNNTALTSGVIGSGDPYSRSNPLDLTLGSGGAGVLANVTVNPGDNIRLAFDGNDYAGVRLTVTTLSGASAPEPGTLSLLALGACALIVGCRSRKGRVL
jgi:hypothetical protein